jgi:hypothetical protein
MNINLEANQNNNKAKNLIVVIFKNQSTESENFKSETRTAYKQRV